MGSGTVVSFPRRRRIADSLILSTPVPPIARNCFEGGEPRSQGRSDGAARAERRFYC